MVGQTVAHYRIVERIGAGAMGEVYRAHDERLDRDVALKLLPRNVDDPPARARLLREARAAASLNHPHICTIHEVGEDGSQAYIAMELVDGLTLGARLENGPLPPELVMRYGAQVADALAHAHQRGVVHRDLKSDNVVLTSDGRAKVLDFGLARRLHDGGVDAATQASLTAPGLIVGTLAYMAPEQFHDQPADARSDVWSLGVVLYEAAAGTRPFHGHSAIALIAAIVNQPVPPLPSGVPAPLRAVIERCLEKEPEQRYQRADELRAALDVIRGGGEPAGRWRERVDRRRAAAAILVVAGAALVISQWGRIARVTGASAPSRIESLAVLPLENQSADPDQEYFTAGMHEALIVNLGKLGGLRRVSARPSVLRYRDTDKSPREIGRELGVEAVMTGSVLSAGNRVRITLHLTRAANEDPIWSDTYERDLQDVLALQSEIVSDVARKVQLQLSLTEQSGLARARQVNPEAYRAYLNGKFHVNTLTREGLQRGVAHFREAIAMDPTDALAYAGLAHAYVLMELFNPASSPQDVARAKAAALKAVELDSTSAEAHIALGLFQGAKEWDSESAVRSFRRALSLNPNLAEAHTNYAQYLTIEDRQDEAIRAWKRGIELDPLSPLYIGWLAGAYWEFGRLDEAIAEANKALELQPDFPVALFVLGLSLADKGRYDDAIAAHRKALELYPGQGFSWVLARTYALAGRMGDARRILARLESGGDPGDSMHPWFIAAAYAAAGENEKAINWLEKGADARILFLANIGRERAAGATFGALRDHPRFKALRQRVNAR